VRSGWESCEWNVEEKYRRVGRTILGLVFRRTAKNSTAHQCESSAAQLGRCDFSTNPQHSSQQQGSFGFIFKQNLEMVVDDGWL